MLIERQRVVCDDWCQTVEDRRVGVHPKSTINHQVGNIQPLHHECEGIGRIAIEDGQRRYRLRVLDDAVGFGKEAGIDQLGIEPGQIPRHDRALVGPLAVHGVAVIEIEGKGQHCTRHPRPNGVVHHALCRCKWLERERPEFKRQQDGQYQCPTARMRQSLRQDFDARGSEHDQMRQPQKEKVIGALA